jgi:hypothetical protein
MTMACEAPSGLVRGLRKQISEDEESVMAGKLLDEIALLSYRIVKDDPGSADHALPGPDGPEGRRIRQCLRLDSGVF